MKKMISILVVVAMMAAMLVSTVSAEEAKPQLVVSSATAAVGEKVTLEVSIVNNPGISNGKLDVTFDAAALKLVEIIFYEETEDDEIEYILGKLNGMNNGASINFSAGRNNTKDGIMFKVVFEVLENASGDVAVSLDVDYIDGDTLDIAFEVVAGKVTVPAADPEPTTPPTEPTTPPTEPEEPEHKHDLVHVEAVEPGCHFTGNIEHWYCKTCDTVWSDEALTQVTNHKNVIVPALGGEVVHVEAKEATCFEEGNIEHWYCETCEQVWQDEALTQLTNHMNVKLGVLEHEIVHIEAVEPGCHFTGNIEHWYCKNCDTVWADEAMTQVTNHKNVVVPALGGEVVHVEAVEPGCHFTGNIEHWYCNECEQVWEDEALTKITTHKSVIIPALGGEVVHVEAKAPTCFEDGNIEHWYCEKCEQVWQDEALTQLTNHKNVILGAAHGEIVHIEAVEPGCHFTGNIEHWYCKDCDTVWSDEAMTQVTNHKNVVVPALGGDVVHVEAKAPTCTEEGNIEHWYCEKCEQVWQDEALTQLTNHKNVILGTIEHNFVDGVCSECGANDQNVPPTGDVFTLMFTLVAASGMGLVALTKKKED